MWTSCCLCALAIAVAAPLAAQRPVPLRAFVPIAATDSTVLRSARDVRELPGGRVLVNDPARHQLLVFDSSLVHFTVALDTAGGSGDKYGAQFATLIPYLGDSTLFVDRDARAFVVLDPSARIVRTMAAPRAADVEYITNSFFGWPNAATGEHRPGHEHDGIQSAAVDGRMGGHVRWHGGPGARI